MSILSDLLTIGSLVKLFLGGVLGAAIHKLIADAKAEAAKVETVVAAVKKDV